MAQLSDVETLLKTKATAAINNLDATSMHALATELDKINMVAANLTAIASDLGQVEPNVTGQPTEPVEPGPPGIGR